MPGKMATPEQTAEVVALREAGFTIAAIAVRTGLSPSTVGRIAAKTKATRGAAKSVVVDAARQDLRDLLKSKDSIAREAARLIADDIAHAHALRERLVLATEHLHANNLEEVVQLTRAAAAYSTALKNTSDMVRHALGYDRQRDELDEEDLPILTVKEITEEEARAMRESAENAADPHERFLIES